LDCYFATATELIGNVALVAPRSWATKLHDPNSTLENPKERSLEVARKLFPNETFLATDRSSKPHEGIIDALLIGYWYQEYAYLIKETEPKPKKKKGKKNGKTRKKQVGV